MAAYDTVPSLMGSPMAGLLLADFATNTPTVPAKSTAILTVRTATLRRYRGKAPAHPCWLRREGTL
jgi:hypothetical protein